jgi:hypothetical protein
MAHLEHRSEGGFEHAEPLSRRERQHAPNLRAVHAVGVYLRHREVG